MIDMRQLDAAAAAVAARWPGARVLGGMVLGSGWSGAAEALDPVDAMPYDEIPGLGSTGVAGHAGRLALARVPGGEILVFQGRRHFYEGLGWTPVAAPIHLIKAMGGSRVLLTNAAGGIAERLRPGDLMIVSDHLMWMGSHPLIGPPEAAWGPRFPDMTEVYSPRLKGILRTAIEAAGRPAHEGVYLAVSGPAYETPAEIRAYRTLGVDAVGMSTAPEAALACAAGLETAALACITNAAAGLGGAPLDHADVTAAAVAAMPAMRAVLGAFWKEAAR